MPLLIFITGLLFTYGAFTSNHEPVGIFDPFITYSLNEINFIANHEFLSLLGVCAVILFLTRKRNFIHHYSFVKRLTISSKKFIQIVIFGFLLSYILLFLIAFVELNISAVLMNINPGIVGITQNRNSIITALRESSSPPQIVAAQSDQKKILTAVAQSSTGNNFYARYILPSIPGIFILPMRNLGAGVVMVGNSIIISKLKPSEISVYSPYLAFLIVRQYFPSRKIKFYPKISILSQKEYMVTRQNEADKKFKEIDDLIQKTQDVISSMSASIEDDKTKISDGQDLLKEAQTKVDTDKRNCVSAGEFRSGKFYRYYSNDDCQKLAENSAEIVSSASKKLDESSKRLDSDQTQLGLYNDYLTFYKAQKNLMKSQKGNIPHELGVFEAPDSIKIIINSDSSSEVADYFETLVHEYLHYASFVSQDKVLRDSFFEEALTEYFARAAVKNALNTDINLGYPIQAKIISEISKQIAESDLADVYFSKDETELETLLDRMYGDGFYKNNEINFEILQLTTNKDQILKIANGIMSKIGGEKLNENDLVSTGGNL